MKTQPNLAAVELNETYTDSADTAVVITLPAADGIVHVIDQICWSYSEAPTGGGLTVTIGGVTVFQVDITAAGFGRVPFPFGLYDSNDGQGNQAVVITLAAGGGSAVGKLNVQRR